MSTIASPRPSIASSSRRNSASTDTTITSTVARQSTTAAERAANRRNRAALRDYYGLKEAASTDAQDAPSTPTLESENTSELDQDGFDPDAYVKQLLSKEDLEGVLRVEAGLIGDIRSLDGEKKALVYDNYSKLIAATDTIRSMREKMDPMTPTMATLSPAIGHIVETAVRLSEDLKKSHSRQDSATRGGQEAGKRQQDTVRWVLDAPRRISDQVEEGDKDGAKKEWELVSAMLTKWQNVRGVDDVRQACLKALKEDGDV